jgi:hypothetical protein
MAQRLGLAQRRLGLGAAADRENSLKERRDRKQDARRLRDV